MPSSLDRLVARLRRRSIAALVLRDAALGAAVTLVVLGTGIVLARAFFDVEPHRLTPLLWVAALALPWAAWRARRAAPAIEETATWLDLRANASGLLLAAREVDASEWDERIESLSRRADDLPPLPLTRPLLQVALAFAFAFAASAIELPARQADALPTGLFDAQLERLAEGLAALVQNEALLEERAEELGERLERLGDLAKDVSPEQVEALFEGLDRMQSDLSAEARRAVGAGTGLMSALADMGEGREAEIAEMVTNALGEIDTGELMATLGPAAAELFADGGPDLANLPPLSDALRELLEGRLGELADAGLLTDLETLAALGQLGTLAAGICNATGDSPFAGTEGGGGAFAIGDPEAAGSGGDPALLPGPRLVDPAATAPIGAVLDAPDVAPRGEASGSGSGALSSEGATVVRHRLSPSQRRIVRSFFDDDTR